ncbi:MAG TPA: hypothetical protein VEW66_09545 [Thermomicrobiales bacterium]|nr:hypothetical protein [Thermomicrobiales bacterium]
MNDSSPKEQTPGKIVVPGRPARIEYIESDEEFEGLVNPSDLGSASRSCLAIIIILVIIGLLVCIFLVGSVMYRT